MISGQIFDVIGFSRALAPCRDSQNLLSLLVRSYLRILVRSYNNLSEFYEIVQLFCKDFI